MKDHEIDQATIKAIKAMPNPTTLAIRDRLDLPIVDVMASLKRLKAARKIEVDRNAWRIR